MSTLHCLTRQACAAGAVALCAAAHAAPLQVTVSVTNLAPTNSISFAPLRLGFNKGTYDAFNLGQVAGPAIISVAEGGSGAAWLPAFAAADPTATIGSVNGLLTPGSTNTATFIVDPAVNRFFTFGAMAVPSNDLFIGNDLPTEYMLFNNAGALQITSILVKANEIWDAGSEVFDPAAAAFVGNNSLRTNQNSVVAFNFAEFYGFNGLTTAAGYVFNSQLTANSDVYRINFSVAAVPEPGTYTLLAAGLVSVGWLVRRRRAVILA
jgi:hypothetical protein